MPVGERWWNPYRMVPVRPDPPVRSRQITHERLPGLSGNLTCTLENLTLFFIGGNRSNPESFIEKAGQPVIPGTSLKGMLRSLAELVGNGCDVKNSGDASHRPCDPGASLCVTCRMFGALSDRKVHMGQVSVGDAEHQGERPRTIRVEILLSSPRPTHAPFYRTPGTGNVDRASRKFYFHKAVNPANPIPIPPDISRDAKARRWIRPLLPGQRFTFGITFYNLRDEELNLLLYCLALQEDVQGETIDVDGTPHTSRGPLRHKLGLGKPVGLGSVYIAPIKMELSRSPELRYRSIKQKSSQSLQGTDLAAEILRRTAALASDTSPTMVALRKMLVWDPGDPRTFKYPSHAWFNDQENADTPLKPL